MVRLASLWFALMSVMSACGGGDDESTGAATPGTTPGTSVTAASTGSSGGSGGSGSSGDTPTTGVGSTGAAASESSGGSGASSGDGDSSTGNATNMTTVDPSGSSSGGPVDCNADCESCWDCAKEGACKGVYDACANATFCIPSLTCIDSKCTPDGIQAECTTTCCMGCVNLMTCKEVNAALACIEQQCAGLCGAQLCPA